MNLLSLGPKVYTIGGGLKEEYKIINTQLGTGSWKVLM